MLISSLGLFFREVYVAALADLILRVEHVGSTAVPGLQAKPILDIDLVIQDYSFAAAPKEEIRFLNAVRDTYKPYIYGRCAKT